MPVERFLDTNILIYAYDVDAGAKREKAMELLEEVWLKPGSTAISVQVLQEFQVNFVRKGRSPAEAGQLIEDFTQFLVVDNTLSVLRLGLSLQSRWQLSLWDAMILAAAQTSGARELVSEDFNNGHFYGSVQVVNPFLNR